MNPGELPLPQNVREALERLLGEGWDDCANAIVAYIEALKAESGKMMLTKEQREALELARDHLHQTNCPECEILMIRCDPSPAIDIISHMFSGSVRAWKVTEERIRFLDEIADLLEEAGFVAKGAMLRAMLEEARP